MEDEYQGSFFHRGDRGAVRLFVDDFLRILVKDFPVSHVGRRLS